MTAGSLNSAAPGEKNVLAFCVEFCADNPTVSNFAYLT